MKLTLGFSPCPNDTFIFDALVNKKIDTSGLDLEVFLEDVETLNQWSLEERLDISKVSYGVLPLLTSSYELLDSGGALGKGVGPLLVSKAGYGEGSSGPAGMAGLDPVRIGRSCVAIPGRHTTAHLLFTLAFPEARRKEFMVFSGIEDAVLSGRVDCGVIIHENRFTYQQRGLVKLVDLGEYWETRTGGPIPLGGIVMKRKHGNALRGQVNTLIRRSLEHAFERYPMLPDYVVQHAQEMDERVMRQHIDLYVNNYSLTLGDDGRNAIRTLMQIAADMPGEPMN
ncbi:MAG: 1,4-dihydroxy-6-naphthoate synthase [Bacteroidota bacterium]|nr:1,4-dihydroxy-6-naphthoate synthase [Bacteroidota bacterium]MDP4218541.1 1,4-dihydroxy-6-naphthoate synthase [Bacteroidota bacterium]MDP4246878.1 1,4-dihydroxy-6-naphthoate synthase [Bacteroidota bacterium]MDP4252749.1 1,4-dihydroxy-6-naphthoate synthase [Bacteroidota bacterium]MDP4256821.1 1,4-dihydroxy-6-naphthoate synthase [Bacteroidota bacterium]